MCKENKMFEENAEVFFEAGTTEVEHAFPTWMVVRMGCRFPKTSNNSCGGSRRDGYEIHPLAQNILRSSYFVLTEIEMDIALVKVTRSDLGFEGAATRQDIYDRALQLGLKLVPHEICQLLPDLYHDQPKNEWLILGIDPINDSRKRPILFTIEKARTGTYLSCVSGSPGEFWIEKETWVFAQ